MATRHNSMKQKGKEKEKENEKDNDPLVLCPLYSGPSL